MRRAGKPLLGLFRLNSARKKAAGVLNRATLFTREGCHLCEDAKQVLERYGFCVEEVDIDQDAQLSERFGNCVPVVSIDGRIRFRGQVNEVLLRRIVAHER